VVAKSFEQRESVEKKAKQGKGKNFASIGISFSIIRILHPKTSGHFSESSRKMIQWQTLVEYLFL